MASKKHSDVKTTVDQVAVHTIRFALNASTGTLVNSTMGEPTFTGGDSDGLLTIEFDEIAGARTYPQLLSWDARIDTCGSTRVGVYRLEQVSGPGPASGSFVCRLMSGTLPAAGNAPAGTPVFTMTAAERATANLTGSITAFFRNTSRTV